MGKQWIFRTYINSLEYFMAILYVSLINSNFFQFMGSLIFIRWYYHSQCFKAVSPASQCHQRFLTAGSPGLSTTITDWCLIRKTGCTVPEDIIETGMVMGYLLIVVLIKFLQLRRRLLCGPNPIMVGSTPEHTVVKTEWLMNWKKTDMQFFLKICS